jgi:hypothetical protein
MIVTYAGEAWPLVPVSLLSGILFLLGFRRTSDQPAIARARNLLQAHILELRLFIDEPAVIWRTQLSLFAANLRLLALLLRPALLLSVPAMVLVAQLDAVYGTAPMQVGDACLVTALTETPLPESITLGGGSDLDADIQAVRIPSRNEVAWRIRPLRPFAGKLRVKLADTVLEKSVVAGHGPGYKSASRTRSLPGSLLHPTEPRLPGSPVRSIEVSYPDARIRWIGISLHWLAWFFLLSTISALAARKLLRVAL